MEETITLILVHALITFFIILVPLVFKNAPPKDINMIYGYRTKRSMKNLETWNEGNRYSAKLMIRLAIFLVLLQIPLLLFLKAPMSILWTCGAWVTGLFMCIFLTEKHLGTFQK